jgi:hypothetical protein
MCSLTSRWRAWVPENGETVKLLQGLSSGSLQLSSDSMCCEGCRAARDRFGCGSIRRHPLHTEDRNGWLKGPILGLALFHSFAVSCSVFVLWRIPLRKSRMSELANMQIVDSDYPRLSKCGRTSREGEGGAARQADRRGS